MTTADREQLVSEQIASIFFSLPDFQLDVALRMLLDVMAHRRGVTPRTIADEFFKTTWSDEEWEDLIRPELDGILGGPGGR